MAETLGSLLPLAILVAVISYFVWRARRLKHRASPGQELRGPHGWLALFIFSSYVFAPLLGLGTLVNELDGVERQYPRLVTMAAWKNYKLGSWLLMGALVAWQWWVAYNLHKKFVPGSVTIAKSFLLCSPFVMALGIAIVAYTTLNHNAADEAFVIFAKGIIPGIVWFLYFKLSKRVKVTYFTGTDAYRAPAPTHGAERSEPKFSTAPADLAPVPTGPAPRPPRSQGLESTLWPPATAKAAAPPAPGSSADSSAYANTLSVQLDALKRMHERGAIDNDEFARKRQELLARI